jgi:hypothetical protein
MDALDRAVGDLREAVEHDRGVNFDAAQAAALLGLIGSAARDVKALARILGMIEDTRDHVRDDLRAMRDKLTVPPGGFRAPIEWRRGRVGMAGELLDEAQRIVRDAQREEEAPTE